MIEKMTKRGLVVTERSTIELGALLIYYIIFNLNLVLNYVSFSSYNLVMVYETIHAEYIILAARELSKFEGCTLRWNEELYNFLADVCSRPTPTNAKVCETLRQEIIK